MNRSGRSLPAGPAITPQASSGWSARAWATILSYSEREMVSTINEHTRGSRGAEPPAGLLLHRLDEGLLHRTQPGIHLERAPLRVVRLQLSPLLLELLGHAEPDAEREPDVVQRLEPGQGLILGQLDAAARLGQRVQHLLGGLVLGAAQRGLGVPAELPGRLRVVAVAVRQQPGQYRVLRRLVRPRPVHHRLQRGQFGVLAWAWAWAFEVVRLDQGHDLADQAAQQGRFGRGERDPRAAAADRPERFHVSWLLVLFHRSPQAVAMQDLDVALHGFPRPRGDHRLALVVHVEPQLGGLLLR